MMVEGGRRAQAPTEYSYRPFLTRVVGDSGTAHCVVACVKEMMCRQASTVVVLADTSKLEAAPFYAWAKLPARWTLVTDDSATEEQLLPFRNVGGSRSGGRDIRTKCSHGLGEVRLSAGRAPTQSY